jgi:hypothetical protein
MKEKRTEPRLPLSCLVRLWAIDTEARQKDDLNFAATIVDISHKGFGLMLPHQLERGKLVYIEKTNNGQVPRFGVVMWSRIEKGGYRIGCVRPSHYVRMSHS